VRIVPKYFKVRIFFINPIEIMILEETLLNLMEDKRSDEKASDIVKKIHDLFRSNVN
jgi:hypothetical protein